jgi:hypothetical protein
VPSMGFSPSSAKMAENRRRARGSSCLRRAVIVALTAGAISCATVVPGDQRVGAPRHVAAFIVAHPDDWQLFMGNVAVDRAASGDSVLFVYVTAGGADRPATYWQAREAGSLASAYVAVNMGSKQRAEGPSADCEDVMIVGHRLRRCSYFNAVSYFLRLPDGAGDGRGFEKTAHQSIEKFERDPSTGLVAVDHSTAYRDWEDLTHTIEVLLATEQGKAAAQALELHSHEPNAQYNPGDHADHQAVGRLVSAISARRNLPVWYYAGYGISQRPVNLSVAQATAKILAFMAYDRQRVIADRRWSAYAEEPAAYSAWLYRTYGRTQLRDQP